MQLKCVWIKVKRNVWRIALVLFGLIFITSYFSFQYAARYVSDDLADDGARVARFDYVLTSDFSPSVEILTIEKMKPGDRQLYTISVQNAGEVALVCYVSGKNVTGNLPLQMQTVSKTIGVGGSLELTFAIEWPQTENSPSFMGKADLVEMTVRVEQVD